jgi:MFS family permease
MTKMSRDGMLLLMLAAAMLSAGSGLTLTLVPLHAGLAGFAPVFAGWTVAVYFLGLVLGAFLAPWLARQLGGLRLYAAATAGAAAIAQLYPLEANPLFWSGLRFLHGLAAIGAFIALENWLGLNAASVRAKAAYALAILIGFGAGQFAIDLAELPEPVAYAVASMLIGGSLLPAALTRAREAPPPEIAMLAPMRLVRISQVALAVSLAAGLAIGALLGAAPASILESGTGQPGRVLGAAALGGALLLIPIGLLSDRLDRRAVLAASAAAAAAASLALPLFAQMLGPGARDLAALLFGGFLLALYPVAVAEARDRAESSESAAAGAALWVVFALAAALGAVAVAGLTGQLGPAAVWGVVALILVGLAGFCLLDMRMRAPAARRAPFEAQAAAAPPSAVSQAEPGLEGEVLPPER